jgi:pilus assembly protein CpaB
VSRRRRAALLLGLALALGGLAASDVAQRERAVDRQIGPLADVLIVRAAVPAGTALTPARLGLRRIPTRFAPPGALVGPARVAGLRTRVALPVGAFVTPEVLRDPREAGAALLRRGERVADVVVVGDPRLVVAGARVDVLVTRDGAGDAPGRTRLALRDVEVLDAHRAAAPQAADGGGDVGPHVAASLRVTLRQAVYLTAAQSFAREIRLLPRAPGEG